ncbi:MAG: HDOD domain-containing protein [Candidatus Accumulibacter meliphilus]|jgi:HD-like signal output (HDOD) protein|uniref:HDOD domain-containing protein n=1 Tax=Candidatus Accumulibacter meliphilus TaxID=2211374 RepID=A0A369XG96_9PROT|nr:MAG: HDOD domain-containing protein [Candidatus Accumulibacter meliphilus]
MNPSQDPNADKHGQALSAQRFQMIKDIADELGKGDVVFPTSFDAAMRLRRELQNPDLPLARVSSIVSLEPLIAAKLLQLANSALYQARGAPAQDLKAAITRLGLNLVRTTALAIAMRQLMRSKDIAIFSDLTTALWNHSLKTAAATRVLARAHTRINQDEALLAGLVHDLGAFYMLYRAAQYPELCARPDSMRFLIMQWHESIGVSLLDALGMPEEIVNATIDHDQPRPAPETIQTLAEIVYIGNILAGTHFEWLHQDVNPNAEEVEVFRKRFADLLPEIDRDAEQMQTIFG